MSKRCGRVGCEKFGNKYCGVCKISCYCCRDCQLVDWKLHKITCVKLLDKDDIEDRINKKCLLAEQLLQDGKADKAVETAENVLAYALTQLIPGRPYRTKKTGEEYDDWNLLVTRQNLSKAYLLQRGPDAVERALVHANEIRQLVEERMADSNNVMNYVALFESETILSAIYSMKLQHNVAEQHSLNSLEACKHLKGEDHTTRMFSGLTGLSNIKYAQGLREEAAEIVNQAYIAVSEVHGPETPDVLQAATLIISSLMKAEDYVTAESYARISYESLSNIGTEIDPESELAAIVTHQLARMYVDIPDLTLVPELNLDGAEAQRLMLRACGIIQNVRGPASPDMAAYLETLTKLCDRRTVHDSEVRDFLERNEVLARTYKKGNVSLTMTEGYVAALSHLADFTVSACLSLPAGEARCRELMKGKEIYDKAIKIAQSLPYYRSIDILIQKIQMVASFIFLEINSRKTRMDLKLDP